MKKVFLHIGPHKTGSTYIQKSLGANREELHLMGVDYPDQMARPHWGHHQLVKAVRQRDRDAVDKFASACGDVVIVSSEELEGLGDDGIAWLVDRFSGWDVHVVFFKRSYRALLVSRWQEGVKHGGVKPWEKYFTDHLLQPNASNVLGGVRVLNMWARRVGRENVSAISYDRVMSSGADICEYMLRHVIGIEGSLEFSGESVNESLDYRDVEIIRALNVLAQGSGVSRDSSVYRAYLRVRKNSPEMEGLYALLSRSMSAVDLSTAGAIASMERHFERAFSAIGPEVTLSKHAPVLLPSSNIWLDEDAAALLRRLFAQVRQALDE